MGSTLFCAVISGKWSPACTLHQAQWMAWAATLWKGAVADNFRPSGATCYTIG